MIEKADKKPLLVGEIVRHPEFGTFYAFGTSDFNSEFILVNVVTGMRVRHAWFPSGYYFTSLMKPNDFKDFLFHLKQTGLWEPSTFSKLSEGEMFTRSTGASVYIKLQTDSDEVFNAVDLSEGCYVKIPDAEEEILRRILI